MKNLLLSLFILLTLFACKPSAERDDKKFLGTWKSDFSKYKEYEGNYNFVVITLSDNDEFPYRVTTNSYSKQENKSSEFDSRLCKIFDGYLVSPYPTNDFGLSFEFKIKGDEFICHGVIHKVRGKVTNHVKP